MDFFSLLALGMQVAFNPVNLIYCLMGVTLGTAIGVLPGVGPIITIALLLPLSFGLPPEASIILLAGIYYGAAYGGSTTSILVNLPGEASSAVTCIDGHQMARQGRAGSALGIAAIGSFIGGTLATVALVVVAMPLASLALKFGPAEFFALMVAGLCLVVGLAGKNILAALLMTVIGLLLAMSGLDPVRGAPRFTFGMTAAAVHPRACGERRDFSTRASAMSGSSPRVRRTLSRSRSRRIRSRFIPARAENAPPR